MQYFWDTLLDADLESDILGWQYISGSLPDGHEMERMDSPQVQGFKFDPDGEYVRQWLPELARIPTEWIHHPWDAPISVLTSAGVDLGSNYPNPIVDIDSARVGLTEAISVMHTKEAAANANGTDEVVFDNSETYAKLSIPNVVVKGKMPFCTISSHDQRVPSMQNSRNKKRQERGKDEGNLQGRSDEGETSKVDDDLCSTAESSSNKKQATGSRCSFSVPQCTSQIQDSSDLVDRWQEEIDSEKMTSENGSKT